MLSIFMRDAKRLLFSQPLFVFLSFLVVVVFLDRRRGETRDFILIDISYSRRHSFVVIFYPTSD